MYELRTKWDFVSVKGRTRHPQTQKIERANQTLTRMLAKYAEASRI